MNPGLAVPSGLSFDFTDSYNWFLSSRLLLSIRQDHSLIGHGVLIAVDLALGCASAFPLHGEFIAFLCVGSFHFATNIVVPGQGENHQTGAAAVGFDGEDAGFDC